MNARLAVTNLMVGKIQQADDYYNMIEKNDNSFHFALAAFAIMLNSEDAKFKIRMYGFKDMSYNIRAFGAWWLYPILCIIDVGLLFKKNEEKLLISSIKYPTPISIFSLLIWSAPWE